MNSSCIALCLDDFKRPIDIELEDHVCLSIISVDYLLCSIWCLGVIRDGPVFECEMVDSIVASLFINFELGSDGLSKQIE